ncbi:hypothetical protein CDAR_485571 [Caerostris darwini]|uniref:Uncharacterized protein n=1 Tax=Caerostris darwini TaxID=1538125 RepID=A0AAV4QZ09_9ARAC|nr:hypothetical protein CDAR_485571 [Caerostris darwini]
MTFFSLTSRIPVPRTICERWDGISGTLLTSRSHENCALQNQMQDFAFVFLFGRHMPSDCVFLEDKRITFFSLTSRIPVPRTICKKRDGISRTLLTSRFALRTALQNQIQDFVFVV